MSKTYYLSFGALTLTPEAKERVKLEDVAVGDIFFVEKDIERLKRKEIVIKKYNLGDPAVSTVHFNRDGDPLEQIYYQTHGTMCAHSARVLELPEFEKEMQSLREAGLL